MQFSDSVVPVTKNSTASYPPNVALTEYIRPVLYTVYLPVSPSEIHVYISQGFLGFASEIFFPSPGQSIIEAAVEIINESFESILGGASQNGESEGGESSEVSQ